MKNKLLIELHKRPQSVFTLKDVSLLFQQEPYMRIKDRMSHLAQTGAIKRLRKGLYAKEGYNPIELANKLYTPSYVSLETVLRQAGIVFQYYERIFSISYVTRTVEVDRHVLEYRSIKKEILTNPSGVLQEGEVVMASPERAFLDAVYLYRNYHFDSLSGLDWEKVFALQEIYQNRTLVRRVSEYYQLHKEQDVG